MQRDGTRRDVQIPEFKSLSDTANRPLLVIYLAPEVFGRGGASWDNDDTVAQHRPAPAGDASPESDDHQQLVHPLRVKFSPRRCCKVGVVRAAARRAAAERHQLKEALDE